MVNRKPKSSSQNQCSWPDGLPRLAELHCHWSRLLKCGPDNRNGNHSKTTYILHHLIAVGLCWVCLLVTDASIWLTRAQRTDRMPGVTANIGSDQSVWCYVTKNKQLSGSDDNGLTETNADALSHIVTYIISICTISRMSCRIPYKYALCGHLMV